MTDYTIPRANAPIAGQEAPTLQWYNYLLGLGNTSTASNAALLQDVTIISEKLGSPDGTPENIPPIGNITQIQGIDSIFANGETIVQVSLVNDSSAPGDVFFYGTSSAGSKGWQSLYSGFSNTANIQKINTAGIVSFNLTPVSLTSGGSLMQYGFDAYGRLSESQSATSDNLTEGTTNLYDIPVVAVALTALSGTSVVALDGSGNAYYPNLAIPSDVARIVGITMGAAAMGSTVKIVTSRDFTEPAWGWLPGRIYCTTTGGQLTQTPPSSPSAIVEVARVISPTTIRVGIQPAILI